MAHQRSRVSRSQPQPVCPPHHWLLPPGTDGGVHVCLRCHATKVVDGQAPGDSGHSVWSTVNRTRAKAAAAAARDVEVAGLGLLG